MPKLARVQQICLPILRSYPALQGVKISTWVEDIDYRSMPMILVRRMGGHRHARRPMDFGLTVIEMTAYGAVGLPETENVFDDALEALYKAVRYQTQTDSGYLHSMKETMGATSFDSPFQDTWRVQGLIQLGMRPPRSTT